MQPKVVLRWGGEAAGKTDDAFSVGRLTHLIASIVQHQGHWDTQSQCGQFMEQRAYTLGIDVGGVGHQNQRMRNGIEHTQNIKRPVQSTKSRTQAA